MSLKNLSAKNKIPKLLKNKLNNNRIKQIYEKFEKSIDLKENFAVAVSGGPDSLALAFLAKIFSVQKKKLVKFLIVDHKLRPESSLEAKLVKKVLKKNSINAEILTWKKKQSIKNIQSAARNKRYELLFAKCDKFKINNILLGHHEDDLVENFFIRLLRGSGLKGLVSLDKKVKIGSKILYRPLLDQKKKDLIFLSKYIFDFYIEDPSNIDQKYLRVVIRKLIEELQKKGLDKKKFIKTINNLKLSDEVINFYTNYNLKKNSYFSRKNGRIILSNVFFQQPKEIVFRSFSEAIRIIGERYYSARGKKLDKVLNDLEKDAPFKTTLSGCIIEKVNQMVIISKEN